MDPVSTAILAAMTAGLARGAGDSVTKAVSDAYGALKALLVRRFGKDSRVSYAVDELEAQPDSKARQGVLQEEIGATRAADDPDIVTAARALLEEISKLPGGEQHVQQATGSYIAQADRGSTARVQVDTPRDP